MPVPRTRCWRPWTRLPAGGDPLLFYWWTPHSAFSKFDLTAFELPAYSDECYGSGAVDCDYPEDVLFNVMWDQPGEQAPTAFAILSNFNYSNEDQFHVGADRRRDVGRRGGGAASSFSEDFPAWNSGSGTRLGSAQPRVP